uniref:Uncharacterized protein n=1 Tax=Arundo donax TaxID=35708 RepID=A0A0A9HM59_ARUDO
MHTRKYCIKTGVETA